MNPLARAWMSILLSSLVLLVIAAWLFKTDQTDIASLFYLPGLLGFLAFLFVTIYDSFAKAVEPEELDDEVEDEVSS